MSMKTEKIELKKLKTTGVATTCSSPASLCLLLLIILNQLFNSMKRIRELYSIIFIRDYHFLTLINFTA